jgi:exopolyphosphatase/guanosine-5'-triphosphate,3'-diphosphate pyrophosphatase
MARYAAVDVGSNSVRMLAAEVVSGGKIQPLAQDRQVTRLGASVFKNGVIAQDAMQFVCENLARMAQEFKKAEVTAVRAVATSAVRDASNQEEFLQKASGALGSPVEIISGQEEARLIHLGVQGRWPQSGERVLMVDVGGGSTEIILSDRGALSVAFSKPLGAVRLTEVFLGSDPPTELELRQLERYIDEKLATPLERIGVQPFSRMIGTSATAAALVCAVNRIPRARRNEADRLRATTSQIRKLYEELRTRDLAARRKTLGIGPRRADLIVAGTAVFLRVLQLFRHSSMYYSAAGVRDGIIADLAARGVGRELSELNRDQRRSVEQMARRYGVQINHARKVASLGQTLFEALRPLHKLPPNYGKLLEAAAYLHDIGHFVSDTGHHKHSFYLVLHSDLPGFTDPERQVIASLCRYHRKSMPSLRHGTFGSLSEEHRRALFLLSPLLRLADSLDRGHEQRIERMHVDLRNGQIVLGLESRNGVDLELWAAARIGDLFREVYQTPLVLARAAS